MSARVGRLQIGISWILRIGVAISLVLETAGMLLNYLQTGDASLSLSPSWSVGNESFFAFVSRSAASFASAATAPSIAALGIAVLLLTPYVRVIASIVYYTVERDWRYVGITALVFAIINAGLLLL